MTGVEPWNVPRYGSVRETQKQGIYGGIVYIQDVFQTGADRPGVEVPRFHPQRLTEHFKPATCPKCHTATLHGIADGITRHLEPRALTDHGEYHAIAAGLRTYNLHPDRTAMPRTISHIVAPDRHPRLAQHACGQQYGDQALPGPRPRPADHDDPPF